MQLARKFLYLCACLIGNTLAQTTYCSPGPTTTVDGNLGKVVFVGDDGSKIEDTQDCPGTIGALDLTFKSVSLHQGGRYTLSYNVTTCGNVFPAVSGAWIDFDHNGSFDASEVLFPFNRSNGWVVTSFTINPTTPILNGVTRMRVQVQETSSTNPLDPCSRFAYGGTKDFSVSIGAGGGSSSSGMSGGTVFIIIVIVVSAVYVIVGCAYNRLRKGTTGLRESCPQNEFWCDLPGLMKDGFLFTKAKLTGKGGGGDGYDKIDDNL